jgi:hypothetical protein
VDGGLLGLKMISPFPLKFIRDVGLLGLLFGFLRVLYWVYFCTCSLGIGWVVS